MPELGPGTTAWIAAAITVLVALFALGAAGIASARSLPARTAARAIKEFGERLDAAEARIAKAHMAVAGLVEEVDEILDRAEAARKRAAAYRSSAEKRAQEANGASQEQKPMTRADMIAWARQQAGL